jgi:hypothetical protein
MEQGNFTSDVTRQLAALVESGTLRGWTLKATVSRSHQRLYSSPDGTALSCHQSRRVNGDAFQLSVFSPLADAASVGMASIDLVPFRPIDAQLKEAIELSLGSKNQAWTLAGVPTTPPAPVETCDPAIRDTPEAVIALIEQQFTEAFAAAKGCRLNSAELFVNYSISTLTNSEGLAYDVEQSDVYLEAAMERAGG